MEPQSGEIELKACQIGRQGKPSAHKAEGTVMQAGLQMTVPFDLCIGATGAADYFLRKQKICVKVNSS